MNIFSIKEYELNRDHKAALADLLQNSFEGYPKGRTYFNQLPSFRFICEKGKNLVGQASIDHRIIQVGDRHLEVWGLMDFCVQPKQQQKGIGQKFLKEIIEVAKHHGIQFIILSSDQSKFYENAGFKSVTVRARWAVIHKQGLFGIHERRLKNTLYVLPVNENKWPEGTVDFLGTMI